MSSSPIAAAVILMALLAGPPISAESPRRVPPRPGLSTASPVRCTLATPVVERGRRLARPSGINAGAPLPPPPPPPPMVAPPPLVAPAPVASEASADAVVSARAPGTAQAYRIPPEDRERYEGAAVAGIRSTADEPVSTFSIDVDTGSYANVRRMLTAGEPVRAAAVRTEEMLNYFRYAYPRPADAKVPFSVTTDVSTTPWNPDSRLLRIGLRGYDVTRAQRPPANLVFLLDVSGSMDEPDKLPLLKQALGLVADRLNPNDRVSIVVYAGAAGIVLDPTSDGRYVRQALACLSAGGSTAGGEGIELAYATARANRIPGGINRVLLATDGDFNVGMSRNEDVEALIKRNREDGITLTTLGFGTGNYNEAMMERIADVGNGNYAYIDTALEAQKVLDEELSSTLFTIAKDVKIQLEFNPAAVSEYRLIGYENRALATEDFQNDAVDAGDIGAGHQVTALYEVIPTGAKGWLPARRYAPDTPAPDGRVAELGWLKLRYKLPDETTSRLIEQPIARATLASATAPRGDMAFATAVAAFGQRLRGDKYLGRFGFADIRALAGTQTEYLRQEFAKLVGLADNARPGS